MHYAADQVRIVSGFIALPIRDMNFGYCPGGCGEFKVLPGGRLEAWLPYSEFGDASQVLALPSRKLELGVVPYVCRR